MKKSTRVLNFILILFLWSCSKNDTESTPDQPQSQEVIINAENFNTTIDENPIQGEVLGSVSATVNIGSVTYLILSQSVAGALNVNSVTGEITVANTALFDFELQTTLTAVVQITGGGGVTSQITVTVNLNDIDESNSQSSYTLWSGPITTFSKPNGGDPTNETNQDRITDNVWITRGDDGQIYNIKKESSATSNSSPEDTEWAEGTFADINSLQFTDFRQATGGKPKEAVGKPMVVHLITDDVYLQIKFTSWAIKKQGGFSYERTTE